MNTAVLDRWSAWAFRGGVVLTAAVLPLDRLPTSWLGPLSILNLLLLAQRPVLALVHTRRLPKIGWLQSAIALALLLPVVAAYASVGHAIVPSIARDAAHILLILAAKAWLLAAFATRADIEWFVSSTLVMGAVVVGLAWLQGIGDLLGLNASVTHLAREYSSQSTYVLPRPQSTALEPLYLGHYLFVVLGALFARLFFDKAVRRRAALLVLLVATLALIVATASRGALLGLAGFIVLFAFIKFWQRPKLRRVAVLLASAGALGAVALAGYIIADYQAHPVTQTVGVSRSLSQEISHLVNFSDRSANTRYELWPQAFAAWRSQPVFGIGLYNSRVFLHRSDYNNGVPLAKLQPLNNDYLSWLAETGLVGIALMIPLVILLVLALVATLRAPTTFNTPFVLTVSGMVVQATTFGSMLLLRSWVVPALALAAYRISRGLRASR